MEGLTVGSVTLSENPSDAIDQALANPGQFSEVVTDTLDDDIRQGADIEVVWGRRKPMGATRIFDLGDLRVLIGGVPSFKNGRVVIEPERGPTPDDIARFKKILKPGDRLSPLSRPTQWVVTSSRGRSMVAWLLRHPPGEESSPDAPVFGNPNEWAVWDLVTLPELRLEGRTLGHCVGDVSMSYHRDVKSGACKIYSVRHAGEPRFTVEWRSGAVVQTQGKSGLTLSSDIQADACFGAFMREVLCRA